MFSFRIAARGAPRAARSLHSCSRVQSQALWMSKGLRNMMPGKSINVQRYAAASPSSLFSTSTWRQNGDSINQELAAKLEQEMNMEKDIRDHEEMPDHLKEYLENCPFTLVDTPGNEEVKLERVFGDEKITVSFSVSDLNNMDEDADSLEDESALLDEMDEDPADLPDAQSGGANTKGAINKGRTSGGNIRVAPEDRVAPADREELVDEEDVGDEEDHAPGFPAHIFVKVERPGKGALQIDTTASDGVIMIENIFYFKDSKHADSENFADEFASRNLYTGPPFSNLDEELQVMFEKYLDERGINTTLALFVPEFIDFKEQREYMTWLQDLKKFVE